MEEDESRFKQDRNDAFFGKFDQFMKNSSTIDNLLRRGCSDDLRSQWTHH